MKNISLTVIAILFYTVFFSQDVFKLNKDFKKFFSKRNIHNIDNSLSGNNFTKLSNKTLPDFLNNIPSLDYDLWIDAEAKEKVYIFKANSNTELAVFQISYLYLHVRIDGIPCGFFKNKRYKLLIQQQNNYSVAMFVIRN